MVDKIHFKITTPERVVFKDDVDSVTLPTTSGEITILPNHIPLISIMSPGEIIIKNGDKEVLIATSGGFVEVLSTKVVVLADSADRSEGIDIKKVEVAIEKAKKLREERAHDSREFANLSALIEKELARAKVGRKHLQRIERRGIQKPKEMTKV